MPDITAIRSLVIVGLGVSGQAAARLARRRLPDVPVTIVDEKPETELGAAPAALRAAGAALLLGAEATLPPAADLLVKSPGVPNESPVVQAALARGLPVWSEVEFASRFLANPVVAITGTNGKTTTTELAGAIFREANVPVAVCGNVGYPIANLPDAIDPGAVVVAEVSSFQLEHIERFCPVVAVLLNLTEDHIDRHGDYRGYVEAKLRVFENQTPTCWALLNGDDAGIAAEAVPGFATAGYFSLGGEPPAGRRREPWVAGLGDGLLWLTLAADGTLGAGETGGEAMLSTPGAESRRALCRVDELALKGDHNIANSLAAAAAAAALGVPATTIADALRTFPGVPHRLQIVATVSGVTYVNDSKATNLDAALKALTAYRDSVHLILGGYNKGSSFGELAAATEGAVKEAILIGRAAEELESAFAARRAAAGERATPFVVLPDLEAAVAHAARRAVPGDVVLLSPACASYDQYRNFEERGEHFIEIVRRLERER